MLYSKLNKNMYNISIKQLQQQNACRKVSLRIRLKTKNRMYTYIFKDVYELEI